MHQSHREIQIVWDGNDSLPLRDHMSEEDGGLITKAIQTVKPEVTLEVGFGCGISTLWWQMVPNASTSSSTQIKELYFVISDYRICARRIRAPNRIIRDVI